MSIPACGGDNSLAEVIIQMQQQLTGHSYARNNALLHKTIYRTGIVLGYVTEY